LPFCRSSSECISFSAPVEFGAASCAAVTTFAYRDSASWLANRRTSIGMFTDAAEIRPAMA
jgi:hypothetical protein